MLYWSLCSREASDHNNQWNTLHIGNSFVFAHLRTTWFNNGRSKFFLFFLFFFPLFLQNALQKAAVRRFPSSHQLSLHLGFDGCVKLKLIVSPFPLSSDLNLISALPPCEVHGGWMPETAHAALLHADPLPRCPKFTQGAELHFFKQQLPTQQNKTLQPLQSVSWMVL